MTDTSSKKLQIISSCLQSCSSTDVKPSIDPNGGGIYVQSETVLKPGDQILSCNAAAVALEPHHRHLCAYCIRPCFPINGTNVETSARCDKCFVVSVCQACTAKGCTEWHVESGECKALYSLVCFSSQHNLTDERGERRPKRQVTLKMANEVDSMHILALRLMHRRWTEKNMNIVSPFPSFEWGLLDELHRAELSSPQDRDSNDAAMSNTSRFLFKSYEDQVKPRDGSWINKENLQDILGKVIGCSHAITDLTAPLGCQYIGRALFLEHSFYNHCCTPNSFLSCNIAGQPAGDAKDQLKVHQCTLNAKLHCIHEVKKGKSITISYIPTSGLSRVERRLHLEQSYNFVCSCEACELKSSFATELDRCVKIPDDSDAECIRQMQFSCNQQLLEIQRTHTLNNLAVVKLNDLERCIATINMNKRGIQFQGIPGSHEVSIESHRLHAKALSMCGKVYEALEEHASFRKAVQPVMKLFDPVTFATTLMEFGLDLQRGEKCEESKLVLTDALQLAITALGEDHILVIRIKDKIDCRRRTTDRSSKRPKIGT